MSFKVGLYDQPQVQAQQAPGVRLNVAAPDLGAPIAKGLQDVAGAMEQEVQSINQARLIEFHSKASAFTTQQIIEAKKKPPQTLLEPGADGESPLSGYEAKWEEFRQQQLAGAEGNEALTREINNASLQHGAHLTNSLLGVQAEASERFKASSFDGNVTTALANVTASPDEATFTQNKDMAALALREKMRGLDSVDVDAKVAQLTSSLMQTRLLALLSTPGGIVEAKRLVDDKASADLLVGKDKIEIIKHINEKFAVVAADQAVEAVWKEDGKPSEMQAQGLKMIGSDPVAREHFKHALDQRIAMQHKDRLAMDYRVSNGVDEWAATLPGFPTFNQAYSYAVNVMKATPTEATKAASFWEAKRYTKQQHDRLMAEHKSPEEKKAAYEKAEAVLGNPELLASSALEDFRDIRDMLDPGEWRELVRVRRTLVNNPGIVKLTTEDTRQLAVTMKAKGYIGAEVPKTPEDKNKLRRAQNALVFRLTPKRAGGHTLKPEEITAEINNIMRETTLRERWGSWIKPWESKGPLYELPPTKEVDGRTVYLHPDNNYYTAPPKTTASEVPPGEE